MYIPIGVSEDDIIGFLCSQPGIIVKTEVIPARLSDHENILTSFLSWDRFVYVRGNFSTALHPTAIIGGSKCRFLHKSQYDACLRCRNLDHRRQETHKCDAYSDDLDVITIKSPLLPLSNYFMCSVRIFEYYYISGVSSRILICLNSWTAADAKAIASRVPNYLHRDWQKICVMREILHTKTDNCERFRESLLKSASKRLVESVRGDIFWSSRLSFLLATSTKLTYYPGRNQLGSVLDSTRQDLMREAVLSEQFGINDLLDPDCVPLKYQPENNVQKITDAQIDLPPLLHLSNITEEGSMNNVKVSTPLVSPGTTSITSLPESSTSQSASISVYFPSFSTNLADCIHVTMEIEIWWY